MSASATTTVAVDDRHDHEAETYDAMAEWILATWSEDDYLIEPGPIPFANREHVDFLTDAIDQIRPLAGKRILEVGSGGGTLAVWLAHQGADVVGIDVSSGILEVARRRAAHSGVEDATRFIHTPIEEFDADGFAEARGGFDAIIGNNVVHHFDRDLAMSRLAALLRPGAIAVFCEPMLFVPEAIRAIRYSAPVARRFPPHTHTEDERSLNQGDLDIMRRHFRHVEWKPFQLTARLQNFVELSDRTWNRLESFDRRLLAAVPSSRRLCRMANITLGLPIAGATGPAADRIPPTADRTSSHRQETTS
ncbi:MAG: methyltransferase domain-containing protein [Microthrixaceae bacterium]|nr:methyltransferase domain-containing protein [Microthrixaceae bacterium]